MVTETVFDQIFPPSNRNAAYTFSRFLRAAAAVPYLCDETNETDETCKRELATMFAHWSQETGQLRVLTEGNCLQGGCDSYLSTTAYFFNANYGSEQSKAKYQYWGRGPKQLSWNANYGRFSWDFYNNLSLVEEPYKLLDDQDNVFVSAMWFYMTPMSLKPSIHEVVVGLWQPNATDTSNNIRSGFGATTNIINGGVECGTGTTPATELNRIRFYNGGMAQGVQTQGTLRYLGLSSTNESTDTTLYCDNMKQFNDAGSGAYSLYFNLNQWSSCELYNHENPFTLYDQTPFATTKYSRVCNSGLDCCKMVQGKLKSSQTDAFVMEIGTFPTWVNPSLLVAEEALQLLLLNSR